ncbi:voltage-dependent calcium channel subunit alpha-2/delta-3-like isoform X2 [Salvelinus alpinus]|uniref:voltage-dependent calcium channel subunit alpha-2/delta-3-like isoform X2 n=1 Tax=Salvelinus alpinus TaxID=8036 RepID=UPI0039FBD094
MKWMACANKGYFSQISTLADVQENVMRYLHVMSRPKVIDHEHDTVWTEAYMDSTGSIILSQAHKSRNKKGPSLMTTVAMPVFSTKNETKNQGILLGVVGTDIPLQELMKIIPKHLLGIHGYAFAITNNGYILTHPDLRPLLQSCLITATPVRTRERRGSRAMRSPKRDSTKPHCFLTQCPLNPEASHTIVSEETSYTWRPCQRACARPATGVVRARWDNNIPVGQTLP